MANIRERRRGGKPVFQAQIRMAGYPSRTATFPTKRLAERWAKTVEAEMIEGKHFRSVDARRRTLAEAIDRYLEHEAPKLRDGRMHRYTLPWWREKLGGYKLCDITPALLVECRDELAAEPYRRAKPGAKHSLLKSGEKAPEYKRKSNTINNYLVPLRRVLSVAQKEWHWIANNPMDGVSKLDEGPPRTRFLSDEELVALLKETAKDPQLHCLALLALSTAARAGELLNLQWRDVDLKEGRMLLGRKPGQRSKLETKNGQARTVWAQGEALRLLRERANAAHRDDDRVFSSPDRRGGQSKYNYHDPFIAAVKAAGIEDFTFHGLRHTAATYLAQGGATFPQLKLAGGWKSNVALRYIHLAANDTKDLFINLSQKVGGGEEKGKGKDSA